MNELKMQQAGEDKVYTYKSDQLVHAIGFSAREDYQYRLALSTFSSQGDNLYEIIQLNKPLSLFQRKAKFYHIFPCSKILWNPSRSITSADILATSGQCINIWEVIDNQQCKLKCSLIPQTQHSLPLTSFDWNINAQHLLISSSIDASFTLWDLHKTKMMSQQITMNEIYDICFSADPELFAMVNANGTLMQYDLRDMKNSNSIYQTTDNTPLIRMAWNRLDRNFIGLIEMGKKSITLIDCRKIGTCMRMEYHRDLVNSICWAPHSATHICSVGDDKQALIWDLSSSKEVHDSPLLEYISEQPISNLCWSLLQNDWLAICYSEYIQILKV